MPPSKASMMICEISRKRKNEESSAETLFKKPRNPASGTRLIITMVLHHEGENHRVQALLDTGCSVALINERTMERLGLEKKEHKQKHSIKSYTGEPVPGAGRFYTKPMLLQHRKYYSVEKFEVSPMDAEIDIFLPFEWIVADPPQGAWTNQEIRFNNAQCLASCTWFETDKFSVIWTTQ